MLTDDLKDEVSSVLHAMAAESGWTTRKAVLRDELVSLLSKKRYFGFVGGAHIYMIGRMGGSYLYDVPLYKQGLLKKFRGKRIRIVCVRSGRYKRGYMAGVVGITPKELVITKLFYTYSFPDYATNSEVVYKTRRYLVFKPDTSFELLSTKELNGFVDLNEWPLIFVDGKDSRNNRKLRLNDDGSFSWEGMPWFRAPTLKAAVKYVTDNKYFNL